jgi:hypothetical protein
VVDEEVLESGVLGLKAKDVKEAGVACAVCGFRTARKGGSARQALRAHLKRHVRDRRARARPLAAAWLALIAAVALALVPALVDVPAPLVERPRFAAAPALATVWPERLFALLCAALAFFTVMYGSRFARTGMRRWSARYSFASGLSLAVPLLAAGSRWMVAGSAFYWPWLAAALLPWAAAAATASAAAVTRLAVKRREFTPANRLRLYRSKDRDTDLKIRSRVRDLRRAIRDGRFRPDMLSFMESRMLGRLGLGDEMPDPELVEAREEAEERRRASRRAREEWERRHERWDR